MTDSEIFAQDKRLGERLGNEGEGGTWREGPGRREVRRKKTRWRERERERERGGERERERERFDRQTSERQKLSVS